MQNPNIHIIDDIVNFEELKKYVNFQSYEYVVLDTETDSVQEKIAKLYGIGICFEESEAFYIPIRRKDGSQVWKEDLPIKEWLLHLATTKKLIGHNIIYDVLVISSNYGIDLTNHVYSDTILLKHTIDENRPFGLKEVAVKYLGEWANKAQNRLYENIEQNGGSTTKDNVQMFLADTEVLADYCAWDVLLTLKLFNLFNPMLKEQGLEDLFYKDEIMPLYRECTIPMKKNGFPIDVEYFRKLQTDIQADIQDLEDKIMKVIMPLTSKFCDELLDKDYPEKRGGMFPKVFAETIQFQLPKNKDGNITLAKKALESLDIPDSEEHQQFLKWLNGELISTQLKQQIQLMWFFKDNVDRRYVFNLRSNDHLKYLLFSILREKPLNKTENGEPQVDDEMVESIKEKYEWVKDLIDFKKLMKLKSTYIDGILEKQLDGVIYTSLLQFGTTSGRYSSTSPNLQNLPRPKGEDSDLSEMVLKYTNAIRGGFVSPKGYALVDMDYSALEPRCFAHMSGDKNLQNIFFNNEDMYSSIAKRVYGLGDDVSSYKKDANFLGMLYPEKRQIIKALALAVTYGAEGNRIAQLLNISKEEAEQIIKDYLRAYPGLKKYMQDCDDEAKFNGRVSTIFKRVRHLQRAKEIYKQKGNRLLDYKWANSNGVMDLRREFKNYLNNAKNFKIQGLAAHIVNRCMINIARAFKEHSINGYVALQIHDQIICIVDERQAEFVKNLIKTISENVVKLDVPLIAEPKIAHTMRESH